MSTAEHVTSLGVLHTARQALADRHRGAGDTVEVRLVLLLSALIDRAEAMLDAAPHGMAERDGETLLVANVTGYTEAVALAHTIIADDDRGDTL